MENERNEDCLSRFVNKWCDHRGVSTGAYQFVAHYSEQSEEVLREMITDFLSVHTERTLLNKNRLHNPFHNIDTSISPDERSKWEQCGWPPQT
jgi:hypothetical protein